MLHCARFNKTRLTDDAAKEAYHGPIVERPGVGSAHSLYHLALTRSVAYGQPRGPFRFSNFHSKSRPPAEQAEQLEINRVYLRPPVLNAHVIRLPPCYSFAARCCGSPVTKKPAATFKWEVAAGWLNLLRRLAVRVVS